MIKNIKIEKINLKPNYNYENEKEFKIGNIFKRRPDGIIIMDTYNNPFFPIKNIEYDTIKFEMTKIKKELNLVHMISLDRLFLPWHFHIELCDMDYNVLTTRPLMYKNALSKEYSNNIIIMISGDSKKDLYPITLYKSIAHLIINSLNYQPSWKFKSEDITLINIGNKFRKNNLIKEFR